MKEREKAGAPTGCQRHWGEKEFLTCSASLLNLTMGLNVPWIQCSLFKARKEIELKCIHPGKTSPRMK